MSARSGLAALAAVAALLGAAPLQAQDPPSPAPVPGAGPGSGSGPGDNVEDLRRQVEDRFAQRVKEQLDLNDDQLQKLRGTSREFAERRRKLADEDRTLRESLDRQMRPGVAADQNEVDRLTRRMTDVRSEYARTYDDEVKAMDYLSPVQRARFLQMRERLLDRLNQVRAQRQQNRPLFPRAGGGGLRGERPFRRRN